MSIKLSACAVIRADLIISKGNGIIPPLHGVFLFFCGIPLEGLLILLQILDFVYSHGFGEIL